MKLSALALITSLPSAAAFAPLKTRLSQQTALKGYLDNMTKDLYGEDPNPDPEAEDRENTKMKEEDKDRYGVGDWSDYVEFDEFDGGDGQMGVAGDGNKKLEGFDNSEIVKARSMNAKNAWGNDSGYAAGLVDSGMDTQRAQQLENWHSQQEVLKKRQQQRSMVEQFDEEKEDENWRNLANFGVERTQDFDMDEEFGAVEVGDIEGVIEVTGTVNGTPGIHEFSLNNPYMGFADFRAAFAPGTGPEWTIEPSEGALKQREATEFILRFKAQSPGAVTGYLVIETEDFKKTWQLIGSTA